MKTSCFPVERLFSLIFGTIAHPMRVYTCGLMHRVSERKEARSAPMSDTYIGLLSRLSEMGKNREWLGGRVRTWGVEWCSQKDLCGVMCFLIHSDRKFNAHISRRKGQHSQHSQPCRLLFTFYDHLFTPDEPPKTNQMNDSM